MGKGDEVVMKKFLVLFVMTLLCCSSASAESKSLIAYFSWSGNTEAVAKTIADVTGFELFEIKTLKPYTKDYDSVLNVAKTEQNQNARPELASHVQNMAQYDTIILGFPCWWGTMPMAVFTFLEEYDFSGKRIIPFVTHGGSSFGRSLNDMRKIIPNAKIESNGLSISGTASNQRVANWLNEVGITVK